MENVKRFMSMIVIVSLLSFLLTGCGQTQDKSASEDNGDANATSSSEEKQENVSDENTNIEESEVSNPLVITTDSGKVKGYLSDDSQVEIFKGIPYAAAPVGDLRWKAPQSPQAWEDVLDCTSFGPSAIQAPQEPFWVWTQEFIVDTSLGYSEDSLSLNVWTKEDNKDEKRPVIVYIHGGGFTSGGSSCPVYDGENIAKKDVVYVSANYRVGILGYLAHPELSKESPEGVSGNYGVLDQIKALEWVKNNIAQFGGDPNNVTIVGQSAGSASVNSLVLSPKAKGLFQNAVTMSYNYINIDLPTLDEQEQAGKAAFGDKTIEEMRQMSTEDLLKINYPASPCVDGDVIMHSYYDSLVEGTSNPVNLLTGNVDGDTVLFGLIPTGQDPVTLDSYKDLIIKTFGDQADDCMAIYPATDDASAGAAINQINIDALKAWNDTLAEARNANTSQPTYMYHFSRVMPGEDGGVNGAFHTAEVPYFLNYFSDLRKDYWTDYDYELGENMSDMLVNFAKNGNPNYSDSIKWEPVDSSQAISYLEIGNESISLQKMDDSKSEFWKTYCQKTIGMK